MQRAWQAAALRVRTDPERVDAALMMLSQLPMRVAGSKPGPAGHSSLWGIARSKVRGAVKGAPRGEAKGSGECPKPGLKREESKPRVSRDEALWQGSARALEQRGGRVAKQAESWKGPWTAVPQTSQPAWKDAEAGSDTCRRGDFAEVGRAGRGGGSSLVGREIPSRLLVAFFL